MTTALLAGGCGRGPRAPVLRNDPVYQNATEGFRFLVPPDWTQQARSNAPAGPAPTDRLLVRYERRSETTPAVLEVSMIDLPPATDLRAYLTGPSSARPGWTVARPPEAVKVGDRDGERFLFASAADRPLTKEVVTVRRGARVYFFTALYAPTDDAARDDIRRALATLQWTR